MHVKSPKLVDSSQAYRGKAAEMDVREESNKTGVERFKRRKTMRKDVGRGDTADVFFFFSMFFQFFFSEVFEPCSIFLYRI